MTTDPQTTEPIRKSSLPTTPPPEWEFHTWFPRPDGGGDMVPGERQRGVLVRRRVAYGDWEPVRPDCWADEPAGDVVPAVPSAVDRAGLRDLIRRAVCEAEGFAWDTDMLEPDEYGDHADLVLAALPAPGVRAAVLREASVAVAALDRRKTVIQADTIRDAWEEGRDEGADLLRRMADEAQQPEARPSVEVECANCWRLIENRGAPSMGGPSHDNWVHVPGGFTVCFPQRGADSPRAEPKAAVVESGKEA